MKRATSDDKHVATYMALMQAADWPAGRSVGRLAGVSESE